MHSIYPSHYPEYSNIRLHYITLHYITLLCFLQLALYTLHYCGIFQLACINYCCMMKPFIKDKKCAISSPMHTLVCISLLRAPSRHNNYQITNNNVDLTNYIPEVYKEFCDLIDSVSVKMLMLVLVCSVHTWPWRHISSMGIVFGECGFPSKDPFPAHFDTSSTYITSSVPTRKQPFDTS